MANFAAAICSLITPPLSRPGDAVDASCISECLQPQKPQASFRSQSVPLRGSRSDNLPQKWCRECSFDSPMALFAVSNVSTARICLLCDRSPADAEVWERSISNYPTPSLFSPLDLVLHSLSKRLGRYFILDDSHHYLVGSVNNVCKTCS